MPISGEDWRILALRLKIVRSSLILQLAGSNSSKILKPCGPPLNRISHGFIQEVQVSEVILYESILKPSGAVYRTVGIVPVIIKLILTTELHGVLHGGVSRSISLFLPLLTLSRPLSSLLRLLRPPASAKGLPPQLHNPFPFSIVPRV